MQNEQKEQNGKVIRKAKIARQLLQCGNTIIDIKGDRDDPDHKRSVFVFDATEKFQQDLDRIMKENEEAKAANRNPDIEEEIQKRINSEVAARVDAAIAERFKQIETFAEV